MRLKIGDLAAKWMVHPRVRGDLILTSTAGIALVDTVRKIAITGISIKSLEDYRDRDLVTLRQDVVDRLLDAEKQTRASRLPAYQIDLAELGVAAAPITSLVTTA